MSILITKNTLHQLNLEGKKKCNLAFLGEKNFKDKNGNRPLDKHIGRAMIKTLHSPRGIGWRGRWEGGLGWGVHVNPWLIHVNV